jgi:hypothetical protein
MMATNHNDLLRRHAPELIFAPGHEPRFTDVGVFVNHPAAVLSVDSGNKRIYRTNGDLSLDFLRPETYPTGARVRRDDSVSLLTLNQWEDGLRAPGVPDPHGTIAYARVVEGFYNGKFPVFLQFWLFTPLLKRRQGDIQLVQIMLSGDGEEPQEVLITQHRGAEVRHIGQTMRTGDGHVRIFVSDRNALLFAPGVQWTRAGAWRDVCHVSRDAPGVRPQLRLLLDEAGPDWTHWPGRLGSSPAFCARPYWSDPTAAWRLEGRRGLIAWVDPLRHDVFRQEMRRRDIHARDRLRRPRSGH